MSIRSRDVVFRTPWFDVVAKRIEGNPDPFYALRLSDYVCVVPITDDNQLVLVRQFRPAVEQMTLELPAGHVDSGETPEEAARRELREETGHVADHLQFISQLHADTGRLQNANWIFAAEQVRPDTAFRPEPGVERVSLDVGDVLAAIQNGGFRHSMHVAAVLLYLAVRPAASSASEDVLHESR